MKAGRIKAIRRAAGLSVVELARVLNLADPEGNGADRVREFERGARDATGPVERILQLLEAGRIPLDLLLE